MSFQPDQAWLEAAREAAARTYTAVGLMENVDLELNLVSPADATGTNSADDEFLDYLEKGGHLSAEFLVNAK